MQNGYLKFTAAVIAAVIAYYLAASYLLPWAPALIPNARWARGYVWLHGANTLVLVAFSIPFALVLSRGVFSRASLFAAFVVSILGLVVPMVRDLVQAEIAASVTTTFAIDLVKFAVVLPLLTWLVALRLPSNNSSKPTPLRGAA